jgi:hypothetical protein
LPASLLQLYEYEIVSSVDASDCSPLDFFLKKNLKVPHSSLSPNNYPVDSLINGAATELDGLLKRKGTSIKPLPPHLSKDLVIFHPLNPTLQPPLAQRKVSPIIPTSRKQDRAKSKAPSRPKFQGNQKPSLLSFHFGCLFRWLYRQQRIIITRVRASQAMLRTRRSKIILHIQV